MGILLSTGMTNVVVAAEVVLVVVAIVVVLTVVVAAVVVLGFVVGMGRCVLTSGFLLMNGWVTVVVFLLLIAGVVLGT